jgi:hypothetical protein
LAKGQCIGADYPLREIHLLGVLGEGEQLVDLSAQLAVEFKQTLVTDRTAFGGIGVYFGSIKTHIAQGQPPKFLGVQEKVHKEVVQFVQKGFAKVGHGVMVGMEAAREEVDRHRLVGRPFDLTGTESACGVAIKQ